MIDLTVRRRVFGGVMASALVFALAACGSSTSTASTTTIGSGGTIGSTAGSTGLTAQALATPGPQSGCPSAACTAVLKEVKEGASVATLPAGLDPALQNAKADLVMPSGFAQCDGDAGVTLEQIPSCIIGPTGAKNRIVLFGDSHGRMWAKSMAAVAASTNSSLLLLVHSGCPISTVAYGAGGVNPSQCSAWIQWAINRMAAFNPTMVVVATNSNVNTAASGARLSQAAIEAGLSGVLNKIASPTRRLVLLGDPPILSQVGPNCLAAHASDVQSCSTSLSQAIHVPGYKFEGDVIRHAGGTYIDVIPWFCTSSKCPAVIGDFDVYENQFHTSSTYAVSLAPVLQEALGLHAAG